MKEEEIKELSLLLLYLTSWEEDVFGETVRRSWKGYPFDVLNELAEEELTQGSRRAKSVYLTDEGIKRAEALMDKYLGGRPE